MISTVDLLIKERKEKNQANMKMNVGSVLTGKVGEMKDKKRQGRIRRVGK